MIKKKIKIERIREGNFRPFGWIIGLLKHERSGPKNSWRIIVRQPKTGWRIAYLVVRDRDIKRLEKHPDSLESFEPVKGRGLLYVSTKKDPSRIRCFLLDRPVILKKSVWHGVVTISKEQDIKITENSKVTCVYWQLGFTLKQ